MNNKIYITLNRKEDYVNKFNDERITMELNNYILDEIRTIDLKEKTEIVVDSKFQMSEDEKNKLKKMIKNNFKDDINETSMYLRKMFLIDTILFFSGIFALLIYIVSNKLLVISEVILIIGWLLIWEGVYNFIFSTLENKIKIARRHQIINSKITFKE